MAGVASPLGRLVQVALAVGAGLLSSHCSLNDLDETRGSGALGGTGGASDAGGDGGVVASGGFPSGGAPDSGKDSGGDSGNTGGGGSGGSGGSGGCPSGQKLCAGTCVAKAVDNGCDGADCAPCALSHATATCSAGQCAVGSCNGGFGDCDQNPSNGCETSLGVSDHCASCTDVCSAPVGTTACVGGACKVTACPSDRADCDGLAGNGCEADLTTSATCASCSTLCAPGLPCTKTPGGNYICACSSDAACLNGGTCYLGFCICGGTACAFNQRCTLIGTCF
ncbi:MAG: hypothetical protein U0263_40840 [Polyangiaceae bacterium]